MSAMFIDPPVGPYHSAEKIRAWIRELEQLREAKPEASEQIDRSIAEARAWLELKQGR